MTVELDFEECLRDSPWFRAALDEAESDAAELETHLEKVLKLCSAVLEAGRVLEGSSRAFAAGLRGLAGTPRGDPLVREALQKFCDSLEQMMDSHEELRSCTQSALRRHLEPLLRDSLRSLRSAGRDRARAAELLQGALQHHAEAPRRRPLEAKEAAAALGEARGVARARGLEHVLKLKLLQDQQKTEILQFVLSLLEAQAAFFSRGHQGATATRDYRGHLGAQLEQGQLEGARRRRDLEQRQQLLLQQDLSQEEVGVATGEAGPEAPPIQGYLYKRASNAFRTWSRRWFFIQSNQLLYLKRARDPPTVVIEDLRLCTVKPCPDLERRFCFEVVSPSKSCVLQADSGPGQQRWVSAVQSGIACAYSQGAPGQTVPPRAGSLSGPPPEPPPVLGAILGLEGNGSCCDCREPRPEWASVNLGITLCIQCSAIHRSLGVHFSKVRSLTLDSWEPELVKGPARELDPGQVRGKAIREGRGRTRPQATPLAPGTRPQTKPRPPRGPCPSSAPGSRRARGRPLPAPRGSAVLGRPAAPPAHHGRGAGPGRRPRLGQQRRGQPHPPAGGRGREFPAGLRVPAAERGQRQPERQLRAGPAAPRHHAGTHWPGLPVPEAGGRRQRSGRGREGPPDHRHGLGQRRHRHPAAIGQDERAGGGPGTDR
ncbi:arf-GAP with coiled-coil, ANK repeat and PH domain-containing protein 1 isoform X3 [Agelaius tricolor]|uniref:arf-GAP with coiled-coil, ANK repeat and PH domain-containing protein 1 isoform X3 n=1 Tax=Agelaius tricolor TaxID=9191 RepID=UPI0039F1FAD9